MKKKQAMFRLPPDEIRALDMYAERLAVENPGHKVDRTGALRAIYTPVLVNAGLLRGAPTNRSDEAAGDRK
jgi:hypothetical protein